MKTPTKKLLIVISIPLCLFLTFCGSGIFYKVNYTHQHCIVQTILAFKTYSMDHYGKFPFSTNGFGNALLLLVDTNSGNDYLAGWVDGLCAPDDDGHIFKEALKNHSVVPEDQCSRVYIQGLSESNDPEICFLFDRNSCKGGDHGRSPWGHRVREVGMLDGTRRVIRDEDWPDFSQKQVELLIAAGFARTNALRFYPAAK